MRFTDKIAEHGLLLGTPSESDESTPSYSLAPAPHKDEDVKPVLAFANRQTQFTSLRASPDQTMASAASDITIEEPFPIFKVAHRYVLYDADTVTYVRRKYNICGVLVGSLAQAPQQNVFLGLPLELMPEEARLLVEKGVAHVVEDAAAHRRGFLANGLSLEERKAYQAALRKQGVGAAREAAKRTDARKKAALKLKQEAENWNDVPEEMLKPAPGPGMRKDRANNESGQSAMVADEDESLFASPMNSFPATEKPCRQQSQSSQAAEPEPYAITPTTSYPPLKAPDSIAIEENRVPEAMSTSYLLFKHMHDEGYFLAPGLRFGCQFMAYPGDPLRFHSHFLCNGMDWDEEFDLLDVVGGGRLGTGVKKGFLIGGEEKKDGADSKDRKEADVRAFCIEWGGM